MMLSSCLIRLERMFASVRLELMSRVPGADAAAAAVCAASCCTLARVALQMGCVARRRAEQADKQTQETDVAE